MKQLFVVDSSYHGHGSVKFSWQPAGNFLATAGENGVVHIFDRRGKVVDQFDLPLKSPIVDLGWDCEGESIGLIQKGSRQIHLWGLTNRSVHVVDTSFAELTFLRWSKHGPQMAVGSKKGNLLIYRKDSMKKQDIKGTFWKYECVQAVLFLLARCIFRATPR